MHALTPIDAAALDSAVAGQPFPVGNHWRATRGDAIVDVFGTFHVYDARMEDTAERIAPFIEAADAVFLEATKTELSALQSEVGTRPELIFIGPDEQTLPERLEEAEWQALSDALSERGLMPFLASKFQPWYVIVLLGIPPCAMETLISGTQGLDGLIEARAQAAGVPTYAIEPYDTLFGIFDTLTKDDQMDLLRATIAMGSQAEDMFATMSDAYFAEEHRRLWEFSRIAAMKTPGMSPEKIASDFALMEDMLLIRRNRAWMEVILPAATEGSRVVVAVGAAHLSGEEGVLNLLASEGFTLERGPF